MKLLQLNIWQGRLSRNAYRLFEKENPDILNLQELCSSGSIKSAFFNNLEEINVNFDYPYQYISPTLGWKMNNYQIRFANGVLSKLPFKSENTVFTSGEYDPNFDFETNDNYNVRNFQHVEIESSGTIFHVLNHHGYHIQGTKDGNEETLKQMKMIKDYIVNLNGGIILTGDFNLSPNSESLNVLNSVLKNLTVEYSLTTTRNQFAKADPQVCDYIFVNNEVKVNDFYMPAEIVSDHQALVLDFDV